MKVIVPDLDGMLILSKKFSEEFPKSKDIPSEMVSELFISGDFSKCQLGKLDLKDLFESKYSQKWGVSSDEIFDFWASLDTKNEEVIENLRNLKLKGYQIVLATNQEKYRLTRLLDLLGGDLFDDVIASCNIGIKKPSPRFYKKILDRLGVKKQDIFFFDDRVENIEKLTSLGYQAKLFSNLSDLDF
ncbi:MAG: HAD-IA family hydrolase [Candidatus Altiarchaeota archaeon]|nr:HAD-IA family hydrolase [Candidatus Altiarchaeota archaeon]